MKIKRYCVTVMDNWTPMRDFWTYKGALAFRNEHLACAHLHQWFNDRWVEVIGPPSRVINPPNAKMAQELRFWGGNGETESQAAMLRAANILAGSPAGIGCHDT